MSLAYIWSAFPIPRKFCNNELSSFNAVMVRMPQGMPLFMYYGCMISGVTTMLIIKHIMNLVYHFSFLCFSRNLFFTSHAWCHERVHWCLILRRIPVMFKVYTWVVVEYHGRLLQTSESHYTFVPETNVKELLSKCVHITNKILCHVPTESSYQQWCQAGLMRPFSGLPSIDQSNLCARWQIWVWKIMPQSCEGTNTSKSTLCSMHLCVCVHGKQNHASFDIIYVWQCHFVVIMKSSKTRHWYLPLVIFVCLYQQNMFWYHQDPYIPTRVKLYLQ